MNRMGHAPPRWNMALALTLAAAACGGRGETGAGAGEAAATGEDDPGRRTPTSTEPQRYLGALTMEGGAEITLCDGTPVGVDGPEMLDLVGLHAELAPGLEPMEGIFVDVLGEMREDAQGPWLNVIGLRRAALEGWGCDRDERSLVMEASGTEPFWTLTVEDSVATWRTPDGVKQFVHDGPFAMRWGGWELESRSGTDEPELRAELYQEPCRNAMSGAWSHLSVEVVLAGRTFRGCGFLGPEAEGHV